MMTPVDPYCKIALSCELHLHNTPLFESITGSLKLTGPLYTEHLHAHLVFEKKISENLLFFFSYMFFRNDTYISILNSPFKSLVQKQDRPLSFHFRNPY